MAQEAKIKLFGIDELDKFFEELKRQDQARILFDSWRIATKKIIPAARRNIKSSFNRRSNDSLVDKVSKSIGFVPKRVRSDNIYARLGARRFNQYKGHNAHWFDEGTKKRLTDGKKSMPAGLSRGIMPRKEFLMKEINPEEIQKDSINNVITAMDKFIQRNLKKVKPPS